MIGISLGTLFFHIGTGNSSILARAKCVSFIYGFMICLSCGGLPFFIEELKVKYINDSFLISQRYKIYTKHSALYLITIKTRCSMVKGPKGIMERLCL